MGGRDWLSLLGSPDVRNAILLNEIGALIHDVGKLSREFLSGDGTFAHHLVLRRLTRGKDPLLGQDFDAQSAILAALTACTVSEEERLIADRLAADMGESSRGDQLPLDSSSAELEAALERVRGGVLTGGQAAFERVARLVSQTLVDLSWQTQQEQIIGEREPPFFPARGFLDGLDQLPFVADLAEKQGRTWSPAELLSPEARLFHSIHRLEEGRVPPHHSSRGDRLEEVRHVCAEVLANQFLEINNIKKDGPGDLGPWFWRSRLYAHSKEAMASLVAFDRGATLDREEMEAVRWLGVKTITRWACRKVVFDVDRHGHQTNLWEHVRAVAGLYKSSVAQALVEEQWLDPNQLSWRTLRIGLRRPVPADLQTVRELVEVEYPLGNALFGSDREVHFTFPGVGARVAARLLEELKTQIVRLLGRDALDWATLSPRHVTLTRQPKAEAPVIPG